MKLKRLSFEGILLVSDMDGTLLDSKQHISEENRKAIERFTKEGGTFTVATGRMELSARSYLPFMSVNAPAILYNGAMIYDFVNERPLWQSHLPGDMESVIAETVGEFPEMGIEIFHGGDIYILKKNEETEKHRLREQFTPIYTTMELVPKPWYKIIFVWHPDKLKRVEKYLEEKTDSFYTVYSEPQFLELLGRGASKGKALEQLMSMLGVSKNNVFAVGDNLNDMDMLKTAGTGIAVANAHDDLKRAAGICGAHHDEHAISKVIEWIEGLR